MAQGPSEQKQAFTINYPVSVDYLAWPKIQLYRYFYQARYSKDSKVTSQEPIKVQFLWDVQALRTPSSLT